MPRWMTSMVCSFRGVEPGLIFCLCLRSMCQHQLLFDHGFLVKKDRYLLKLNRFPWKLSEISPNLDRVHRGKSQFAARLRPIQCTSWDFLHKTDECVYFCMFLKKTYKILGDQSFLKSFYIFLNFHTGCDNLRHNTISVHCFKFAKNLTTNHWPSFNLAFSIDL